MRARPSLFFCVVAWAASGCSILFSPDGFDAPPPPDASTEGSTTPLPEAAPPDAPAADVTTEDSAPEVENLAPSEDLATCADWGTYNSKLSPDPNGRTGGGCRVCGASANVEFSIDGQTKAPGVKAGEVFYGEIWVRAAPGASPFEVHLTLRSQTETYDSVEAAYGPHVTLGQTWTKLDITFRPTKNAARMDMYVFTDSAGAGACFIVDDARVERR